MASNRELLDRLNRASTEERQRLAAAARQHAAAENPLGLRHVKGERVRDLESGLVGVIQQAGRDAQTGWELYRVLLSDLREVFRTERQLTRVLALLLLLASPAAAQTKTAALEWDYVATSADVVKTYSQAVTVDGVAQTGAIACATNATRPADTTCSIPLGTLATGSHVVTVTATANGHTAATSISGVDLAKVPASASTPRVKVSVTVVFP